MVGDGQLGRPERRGQVADVRLAALVGGYHGDQPPPAAARAILEPDTPVPRLGSGCCGEARAGSCCTGICRPGLGRLFRRGSLPARGDRRPARRGGAGEPGLRPAPGGRGPARGRTAERVLDVGSGGGIDVLLSARRVGPSGFAYGMDMTDDRLELTRKNAAEAGTRNVEFLISQIEDLPLPAASVDVVSPTGRSC